MQMPVPRDRRARPDLPPLDHAATLHGVTGACGACAQTHCRLLLARERRVGRCESRAAGLERSGTGLQARRSGRPLQLCWEPRRVLGHDWGGFELGRRQHSRRTAASTVNDTRRRRDADRDGVNSAGSGVGCAAGGGAGAGTGTGVGAGAGAACVLGALAPRLAYLLVRGCAFLAGAW